MCRPSVHIRLDNMDDEYDYLQPGFDPKGLTVPRLRSILVAHDVQYPGTAKKPQLIELFNEGVVPKAKKFLDKQARAKRSSMGIIDMPRGNSQTFDAFDDELAPPPQSVRRSRSPRKASARLRSEDYEEPEPAPIPSPTKRKGRISRQVSEALDDGDIVPQSARRVTRAITPQVKVEESERNDFFKTPRVSENFSAENPFQSGSSPPAQPRPSSSRRRTGGQENFSTYGYDDDDISTRRQTDGYERPKSSKSVKKFEVSPSKKSRQSLPAPEPVLVAPDIDAGEEFTPEEQFELELEMRSRGETALEPRRAAQPPARATPFFKVPFAALSFVLLATYAGWYRQEKVAVGYCGLGRDAVQLIPADIPVPDWVVPLVEPQCEPCPAHAFCFADYSVRCEQDFILVPHPLSLGGIVPLPPTCEPDGEKVRRVKAVADKAVEELRERRAQFECGELVDDTGKQEETPAIEEEELRQVISQKRSKKMNKQEFDDLWAAAIGEVKDREEVETVEEANPAGVSNTYLSSSSLARLSLTCSAKRSFRLGLERYRLPAGALGSLIALYFYLRARWRTHKVEAAKLPGLVDLVLARLAAQKELGEEEIDDPWLFLPNLRDDVLRSIHSLSVRDRIWAKVKVIVEQNSNVRTGQREGRSGEVGRAWEWIGPIGGDSVRRRRSGRVSLGADIKSEESPVMEEKTAPVSKWEESRPLY